MLDMDSPRAKGEEDRFHDDATSEIAEEAECDDCNLLHGFSQATGSLRTPTRIERREFFHAPCRSCSPDEAADPQLLCSVCRHMRPRHLLQCLSTGNGFKLELGTAQELQERPDCRFCSFVLDTVIKLQKEREEDIRAHAWVGIETYELQGSVHLGIGVIGLRPEAAELRVKVENLREGPVGPLEEMAPRDMVPWDKVRGWMNQCEDLPERPEDGPPLPLPKSFRLIDVRKRCIVVMPARSDFSYVALSYVWGAEPKGKSTTALRSNIVELRTAGSLKMLPNTIEDAIQACLKLGERYLWADRLCIVQDDLDDKKEQIASMGSIYSSASLVIIAACGGHMDIGLAGVTQPRAIPYPREVLPGLLFIPKFPHYYGIHRETIWASRGWTYQEAVLAKRKLLFTPTEMWFDCSHGINREIGDPMATIRPISLFRPGESKGMFAEFVRHMSGYSRRRLTNQSDVYAAIEGILSELYKGDVPRHYYGLPCRDFDISLLWTCSHIEGRSSLRTSESVFLPTWSWSSFNGGLTRLPGDFEHHFCSTLLTWATYDYASSEEKRLRLKSLKCPSQPLIWTEIDRYLKGMEFDDPCWCPQLYLALACQHGLIEGISPTTVPWDTAASFASLRSTLQARYPTYSRFWGEIRVLRDSHGEMDAFVWLEKEIDGLIRREDLRSGPLVTRAQVAPFLIGRHHPEDCKSRVKRLCHHCDILDEAMLSCGYIHPDELRISPPLCTESVSTVDVMALSISVKELAGVEMAVGVQESRRELERIVRDEDEEITFFDGTGEALMPCPVVNVMLIGRRSNGISYRMGIGWILMRSWVKAKRTFRPVVLE